MRITISGQPWKGGENPLALGNGGSGPAAGYVIGETEDYLFKPELGDGPCTLCQDLNGDGRIDLNDLWLVMDLWLVQCLGF